jgi:hypothetical protein
MTAPFDRILSLSIDMCHWQLDQLADQRGLRAMFRRWQVRRTLRKLERRIPHV